MTSRTLYASLLGSLMISLPAFSAAPSPTALNKLGNMAFGWVATSGGEVTGDTCSKYASQNTVLIERGKSEAAEIYQGSFSFNGFNVDTSTQAVLVAVGPGVARISRKSFSSNMHPLEGLPTLPVKLNGEAYELSYAQRFNNTSVGVSIIPKDNTALESSVGSTPLIKSWVHSKMGGRVGVTQFLPNGVRLGLNYSYQEHDAKATLYPAFTKQSANVEQTEKFLQRCVSYGASWQCNPKTTLYFTEWDILDTGSRFKSRESNVTSVGVKYAFTPNLNATVNSHDGSPNFHLNWITRNGIVQFDFTDGAIPTAKDLLGHGQSVFLGFTVMK